MLADNGQLSGRRVGMIVVDELHLLAEQKRGALLDATITKVLDSQQFLHNIQIIGMSATTGNMQEIGDFLNAHECTRDFRPVKLTETIKLNEQIFVINKDVDGSLKSKLDRKLDFDFSACPYTCIWKPKMQSSIWKVQTLCTYQPILNTPWAQLSRIQSQHK
ncbi:helicase POLQ-like [Acyrthosiphon pisum]|uniref:Helicase ATP-binding domain-containing protein n=1 Tax=Acyrthosiphon pisum TaxID=7029 RepID=A0A8R2NVL1_ACYPI|nr:helicase POLQ-like [Acyrthosiphon pisum]XP_008181308.1 helicase POLQ-like [Acyrthosiphon pisum]XP_029347222.1 helicase POLQ-like [Acyrthosiphon pisum]|eukprot:XP_008181307.1 PREDICTED: helicase POLQ-like [Acyrthosiphon pisum]